ncbi:flavin oxidoreductase [Bisporella sp. PMI_857]|nr:flavin oxidoreductase [Bisporella sp. PMI_857]
MGTSLNDSVKLPCSLVLPNRIVKAAMQELLADANGLPSSELEIAYSQWADGNWGGIITGNVQVDRNYLGALLDVAIGSSNATNNAEAAWRRWAEATQKNGTPGIVQICHPGRQSPVGAAPSAIPLTLGDGKIACALRALIFGTLRAMAVQEIKDTVQNFANAAQYVAIMGFSGVEIHAAHGYLLAQFLSPQANKRTDEYGGTAEKRARIIVEIIDQTRKLVPYTFCIGVKFNSVDYQSSADLNDCTRQIQLLVDAGIDFLKISGGSYKDPKFLLSEYAERCQLTAEREAFFISFAKEIRQKFPDLILMVTGGFRTRCGMKAAVNSGACDFVGLARPAVANLSILKLLLDSKTPDEKANIILEKVPKSWMIKYSPVKLLKADTKTDYYSFQIHRIGKKLALKEPKIK